MVLLHLSMSPSVFPYTWHGDMSPRNAQEASWGGVLFSVLLKQMALLPCILWVQADQLLVQTPVELGARALMSRASHYSWPGA